jgi:hypothetical protein
MGQVQGLAVPLQKFRKFLVAFPLSLCPEYRKFLVAAWLDDIDDRLASNQVSDAEKSWKIANEIYLSLPPGEGNSNLETWLFKQQGKINQITYY